jgi:aspartyl-tRNA(Asn)/glutamyl-tRNA(Gln) amidotransferase subunit A
MIDPETSALDIARAVASGETSAVAVTEAALGRIATLNPRLNAFTAARARKRATALDARRAAGDRLGPLAGVPFAVKNLFDVAGLSTRAGAAPWREDIALRIARALEAAGAVTAPRAAI